MVKHIVFWKIKPEPDIEDTFREMKTKVEALNGEISGLIKVEFGRDFNHGDATYDVALYTELEDNKALNFYQEHPLHQQVKEFIGAVTSERCVVDYVV